MRLPHNDLDAVLRSLGDLLAPLRGGRILITGATGFFGRWMLESLVSANQHRGAGLTLFAQSRDPARFLKLAGHLGTESAVHWLPVPVAGLTRDLFMPRGLDAIIHLVTEANDSFIAAHPAEARETIVGSTARALDLAMLTGARYFLFTSSGSVYRRSESTLRRLGEDDPLVDQYESGTSGLSMGGWLKREAEERCGEAAQARNLGATVARCFSFAGPGMPLGGKFALGNFISDALQGRNIVVRGDGTPVRSYLYATDLVVWLLKIMLMGKPGRIYNVGSEQAVTLISAAETVQGQIKPSRQIHLLREPGRPNDYYVPATERARREIGLRETLSLREAIARTMAWASDQAQR